MSEARWGPTHLIVILCAMIQTEKTLQLSLYAQNLARAFNPGPSQVRASSGLTHPEGRHIWPSERRSFRKGRCWPLGAHQPWPWQLRPCCRDRPGGRKRLKLEPERAWTHRPWVGVRPFSWLTGPLTPCYPLDLAPGRPRPLLLGSGFFKVLKPESKE